MTTRVVLSFLKLEDELRAEGYKGTHRAMRLLKDLQGSLADEGHNFSSETSPVKERSSKKEVETFEEALDNLG